MSAQYYIQAALKDDNVYIKTVEGKIKASSPQTIVSEGGIATIIIIDPHTKLSDGSPLIHEYPYCDFKKKLEVFGRGCTAHFGTVGGFHIHVYIDVPWYMASGVVSVAMINVIFNSYMEKVSNADWRNRKAIIDFVSAFYEPGKELPSYDKRPELKIDDFVYSESLHAELAHIAKKHMINKVP